VAQKVQPLKVNGRMALPELPPASAFTRLDELTVFEKNARSGATESPFHKRKYKEKQRVLIRACVITFVDYGAKNK